VTVVKAGKVIKIIKKGGGKLTKAEAAEAKKLIEKVRAVDDAAPRTGVKPGSLAGSLDGLTASERAMVQELRAQGKNIEIIPRGPGKTPDFKIDGVPTELKTLTVAGKNTVKNAIEKASEQGEQILIDARNVPISKAEALTQNRAGAG
jgi:hypothetical protein